MQTHSWVPGGLYINLPENAVCAGNDQDGSPIYVGRYYQNGEYLIAKVIPSKQAAYVAQNGVEILIQNYELLTGSGFTWSVAIGGQIPHGAVMAGNTTSGEAIYVGRGQFAVSTTPGRIIPSHGRLYIPFDGAEKDLSEFEYLVSREASMWMGSSIHAPLPAGAVLGGTDADGTAIFVGRAFHEGDLLPAKLLPSKRAAYVSYNGREVSKEAFEVLCHADVSWVPAHEGQVPVDALVGGMTAAGERLYIGRGAWQGSMSVGKIHPSHRTLYIPFDGTEVPLKEYEVLVWKRRDPEQPDGGDKGCCCVII